MLQLEKDVSEATVTVTTRPLAADRKREIAEARAELLRRAEAQDVSPITSVEDLAGDPEITGDFDVDGFLRDIREDRDVCR